MRRRLLIASALTMGLLTGTQTNVFGRETHPVIARAASTSAGLASAVRSDWPPSTDSVFVLGDSLMVGVVDPRYVSGPSLLEVLQAAGIDTASSVQVARTIRQAESEGAQHASAIIAADTVVIGLGTNDIFNSGGVEVSAWRASVAALVDAILRLHPTVRIIWVDVSFERFADRSVAFNQVLAEFGASDFLEVCPWRVHVISNPQWLGGDGLHLNPTGYTARRNLILSCIERR